MIDLARIDGFQWDSGNSRKNIEKHGVSQGEAEQIFFNRPIVLLIDEAHNRSETRFHALCVTDDARKLHITFTLREDGRLIRVISARDMSSKERSYYEQEA